MEGVTDKKCKTCGGTGQGEPIPHETGHHVTADMASGEVICPKCSGKLEMYEDGTGFCETCDVLIKPEKEKENEP